MIRNIQEYSRQIHKNFRHDLVHGFFQSLLDKKANGELVVQHRKTPNLHATQLQGKLFPSRMYQRRGVGLVGIKRQNTESKPKKRPVIIAKNVKCSFARNLLKVLTPRIRSEHY